MRAFAKSILISILVSVAILLFTNFIYFFPWYMTLVVETFHLSQAVASDNYLTNDNKDYALKRLKERPVYRDKADQIVISAEKDGGGKHSAEGGPASLYEDATTDAEKPYMQRGNPVTVRIEAVYPLSIKLWGKKYEQEIPVSFSLTTTGLKHYKDLGEAYEEYLGLK
ncbi:hypothetical protein [Paenibacillus lentus]|uniref:Uncharacterized protein n=1 Tax=Paenibacillus lentus TaxID=1338368 RepID=A0A3S8S0G4_9BACL|nr:hypothetical protein [Paenibacillus lentus]AZK48635.1 hypothetical protein EIM92_22655 [Paenibacillus lentus]